MAAVYRYERESDRKSFRDHLYNIGGPDDAIDDARSPDAECGYLRPPAGSQEEEFFVVYVPSKETAHIIGDGSPIQEHTVTEGGSLQEMLEVSFLDSDIVFA